MRQLTFQPTSFETIERPPCPGCPMALLRIAPDSAGHDKRTFRCHGCGREVARVVKFRDDILEQNTATEPEHSARTRNPQPPALLAVLVGRRWVSSGRGVAFMPAPVPGW